MRTCCINCLASGYDKIDRFRIWTLVKRLKGKKKIIDTKDKIELARNKIAESAKVKCFPCCNREESANSEFLQESSQSAIKPSKDLERILELNEIVLNFAEKKGKGTINPKDISFAAEVLRLEHDFEFVRRNSVFIVIINIGQEEYASVFEKYMNPETGNKEIIPSGIIF